MENHDVHGRPARELSDEELEQQGTSAHETRNWVFLHGSAEQYALHTTRMLELEWEYIRRFPKRTWQSSGGLPSDVKVTAEAWAETLRGVVRQLESLVELPDNTPAQPVGSGLRAAFLQRIADAPGGRMHKLEAHQAAREVGLDRAAVATLYNEEPALLAADLQYRVVTDVGRAWLAAEAG
ncbi:DUF6158 family protein [Actinacidiphila oryziradicis]|uniref:DUF6158 family protein n=1 Tax=Actinacidiphila oryziradicis TaxID=2571141 RepID=UPI001B7FF879|nr:DUF6158 family protein [Actinacidiphila oryziradicis]